MVAEEIPPIAPPNTDITAALVLHFVASGVGSTSGPLGNPEAEG